MEIMTIETRAKEEFLDITSKIQHIVVSSPVKDGLCLVYVPHTTAGVTINENADPSVRVDLLMALKRIVPDSLPFTHGEGNSPAHMKSTLVGSSVTTAVHDGRLALGTWQGIFFCEFDGPRRRRILVQLISA